MHINWFCSILLFLGRLCISAIFLISGISKFVEYNATAQMMAAKGLSYVPVLLIIAALIEIICSLSLIFGYKTRLGSLILLLYLIPVTYVFHNFWALEGADRQLQMIMFLKNLAIFGGLLEVLAIGAGGCGCDRWCRPCKTTEIKTP